LRGPTRELYPGPLRGTDTRRLPILYTARMTPAEKRRPHIVAVPWRIVLVCGLVCAGLASVAAGVGRASGLPIRAFALPGAVGGLTRGADGNIWFTVAGERDYVGRAELTGIAAKFRLPGRVSPTPAAVVGGPDGNLWFVEDSAEGRVWRTTPLGQTSSFRVPGDEPWIQDIATGSDGNLWFTDRANNAIGRMTPAGEVALFSTGLGPTVEPSWIATGAEGDEWFTEAQKSGEAKLGRVTPT
jgi:streptogramin lyase